MSVNLSKGQKINLSKEVQGLNTVMVGLGWDPVKKGLFGTKCDVDCDASAIFCKDGKYAGVVCYSHLNEFSGAIHHHGDNLTGNGDGDDERITVKLDKLPHDVDKIVFAVNIYAAAQRKQDFGMIQNAFIRIVDEANQTEICRYNLSEKYDGKTAMIFGELYKHDGEWKFNAVGQGTTDNDISSVCRRYQ